MRICLDKFAVIRPDPSFDVEPSLTCQLEDSYLRRLRQDTPEDAALPLLTQSSEVEEVEEADRDVDDGIQSAANSCDDQGSDRGSGNEDNSIDQEQESSLEEGDSDDDEVGESF